jgi:hypothetical protein
MLHPDPLTRRLAQHAPFVCAGALVLAAGPDAGTGSNDSAGDDPLRRHPGDHRVDRLGQRRHGDLAQHRVSSCNSLSENLNSTPGYP